MKSSSKVHQFIILTVIGLLMFYACGKPNEVKKLLTIPEAIMVKIMSDVHLAEAVIQSTPGLQRDSLSEIYYASIFKIHNITEAEFLKNRKALLSDPEVADAIYEKIIENLSKEESLSQEGKQKYRNPAMEEEESE